MTLDKSEAAQALADIGENERRSSSLYSYSRTAPYVFIAGVMWFVADMLLQFGAVAPNLVWPITSAVGVLTMLAVSIRQSRTQTKGSATRGGAFWRIMGLWLTVFAFIFCTFAVFKPTDGTQVHTFFGVFFGFAYIAVGFWMGWRILAVGVALAALSMVGFYAVHDYYLAYMGVVCGGGLMISALWLRTV